MSGCSTRRVLRVISEPVAAAIAYDLDQPNPLNPFSTFAVFNIGSRSCEVSCVPPLPPPHLDGLGLVFRA